jgi:hypothetical protein
MAAEGQSDKMASDMEVRLKQRCVTEFLHAEKNTHNDIHRCLLNVYGDKQWMLAQLDTDSKLNTTQQIAAFGV